MLQVPVFVTFVQVAMRAPKLGAEFHAEPVEQLIDMTAPWMAGEGSV